MTKKSKRRIKEIWGDVSARVTDHLRGTIEVKFPGEKLDVAIVLDECDAREIIRELRAAFGRIKESRDLNNRYNFESFNEESS